MLQQKLFLMDDHIFEEGDQHDRFNQTNEDNIDIKSNIQQKQKNN